MPSFLDSKDAQVEAGVLLPNTFNQYRIAAKRLCDNMGAARLIDSLGPSDFTLRRGQIDSDATPTTVKNQINLTRMVIKWAYDNELLDRPVRFGSNFSRPSAKRIRISRRSRPKVFSLSEIRKLFKHGDERMQAWILLGMKCGFGNSDLSRLTIMADKEAIDAEVKRIRKQLQQKAPEFVITYKKERVALRSGGEDPVSEAIKPGFSPSVNLGIMPGSPRKRRSRSMSRASFAPSFMLHWRGS